MSSIDERVVKMRLDNSQFEQGIGKTSSLLGKLKQALNLDKSVESINNVDKAVSGVSFNPLTSGLQGVQSGFNAMGAVAFSVLNRMTNAAIDAGKSITNALTASVRDGFAEYETQMNAVQTILANTQSKGSTIDDVNSALDTLNTYADKTIYNFTEMTRNIGTFTAAGVDLQTSVDSIKGIANLAAVSGSSSAQASQAMYQLSQAIAAGKVQLMDWNSVVNAGMGGEVFQNALKRTAENFGTDVDGMIQKYGSFRESLTQGGWLTTDVLTETLKQLSGAYTEADLVSQGYTEEQAKQIVQLANTAEGAATDVKTFSQLIDTTKEALASGWTNTFEIIFGDFEEAKELWSGVADVISDVVNRSSESRNNLLQGWKDLGGRTELIKGLSNVFESLGKVLSTVGNAFRKVFPPTTSRQLMDITEAFTSFTESLIPSESTLNKIGRVAEGVFSIFDIGVQAVKAVGEAIATAFGSDSMGSLLDNLLDIAAGFGDWLVGLDNSIKQFGIFEGAAKGVGTAVSGVLGLFSSFTGGISSMGSAIGSIASTVGDALGGAFERVKNVISDVLTWITDNISGGDIFAGLAGGGIFLAAQKIGGAFDTIKETVEDLFGNGAEKLKSGAGVFDEILGSLQESLNAFTGSVKAFTLVEIAGSIALLVDSMEKIAALSGGEVVGGVSAIGGLMTELNISLKSITKTMKDVKTTDLIKTGAALVEFAKAVDMLANAMSTIGKLDWDEIAKGLTGMGGAMAELVAAAKGLSYAKVDLKTAGSLIAMAQAVKMVADPLKKLGSMSWDQVGKGLSAMGGALTEMGTVTGLLGRFGKHNISAAVSMVITAKSLGDIADAFGSFSSYDWGEIGRGLTAMGGALGEVGLVTGALGKIAGFSGILGGGSIFITVQSLGDIAEVFGEFTQYDWGEIGRGLTAMGGALGEVGLVTGALGKLAGFSGIIGGGSILITAQSLGDIASAFGSFTQYDWGEIGRGLTAMGGALTEVGVVSGALGKLAGLSGIIGSGSIVLTAQGLGDIAKAFNSFSQYSWDEIGRGLVAMGGALGEVAVVSGALGKLAGLSGLIGAGTINLTVQGLDEIAQAFNSFSQYSWDEIGRGLVAMGGAMGEVAAISGATGALTGIAGLMGAGTITLASQGLIDLATAFGKFAEFNWDEIGRGLTAMGAAMGETALGGLLNTFSGFGAGAIEQMAAPLGTLADSIKKWEGVAVPNDLADQLGRIADGVGKFTLAGWGGDTVANIAQPMNALTNAVAKWSTIKFPTDIATQLGSLANGVEAFTMAFAGGWSLNAVVGPLGTLADSVKKWDGVEVPGGIQGNLTALANGVKAFTLAFAGGWSIDAVIGPLGQLPGAVKKWNGVEVPGGIQGDLTALANGVKAFSLAFVGGWSLSAINEPLGQLAGAVKKWDGVEVPGGIQGNLTALANGVKAFVGGGSFGVAIEPVGQLAGAVKKWNGVKVPGGIQGNLTALANGVKAFTGIGSGITESISNAVSGVRAIATAATSLSAANLSGVSTQISTFVSSLNATPSITSTLPADISAFTTQLSSAMITLGNVVSIDVAAIGSAFSSLRTQITTAISGLGSIVSSNMSSASNAVSSGASMISGGSSAIGAAFNRMTSIARNQLTIFSNTVRSSLTQGASSVQSSAPQFLSSGKQVTQSLVNGMKNGLDRIPTMFNSTISTAASNLRSFRSSFYSAGTYVAQGFASGISSQVTVAAEAAARLANAASSAAKEALDIHSPSKVFGWIGEMTVDGFVNTVDGMTNDVRKSGYGMAESVISGFNELDMSGISDPSIRPVMDLSMVRRQASDLSSMLSTSTSPIKADIDFIGRLDRQNGGNYQVKMFDRLISATDKNAKELSDLRGDLSRYNDSIAGQETAVYVDGKKLASSIAKPMNKQLGLLSRKEGI
jgi:tape measure domain-containing protein|nr:MAG TPA: tail tape measure [Caudoviricetes sp.]